MNYEETPRPVVKSVCRICKVTAQDVRRNRVVVSPAPAQKAHHARDYGMTCCGKDATGDRWWWPL